jgi:putative FmdB family regulatory protein
MVPASGFGEDRMPIYEYLCPKCRMEFEIRRSFSEADKPAVCPKCNSEAQKLISGFACKTGSYIQASPKPFRGGIAEKVEK